MRKKSVGTMDHIAIMKKAWQLIPKIVSGEKTVESRWYRTKRKPWDAVHVGDRIFFKNAGDAVTVQATVSHVFQYEITDVSKVIGIIDRFGKDMCLRACSKSPYFTAQALIESDPKKWEHIPRYCILMKLQNVKILKKPFHIDKTGFGIGAAWITVKDVADLKQ